MAFSCFSTTTAVVAYNVAENATPISIRADSPVYAVFRQLAENLSSSSHNSSHMQRSTSTASSIACLSTVGSGFCFPSRRYVRRTVAREMGRHSAREEQCAAEAVVLRNWQLRKYGATRNANMGHTTKAYSVLCCRKLVQ